MMMQPDSNFPMMAKTFRGLEDVLRDELIALGAENVEIGNRMVSFEGNLEMLYKANLCLRTAVSILVPIEKFMASDPDELYDRVLDIDWDKYLTPDTTFSIDSTVNSADFTHSRFVTYRVKDGIVDYFSNKYGRRPSIRIEGAQVQLNVHISDNRVTLSLNSSGDSLSRRGYKEAQTEAPVNEALAAGIIMKTGWRGDTPFVDPMCGSGTFLIEAALIAANINPGIFRDKFAFEDWPNFDRELFEKIYNDDSAEREPAYRIYGGDIDPEAVQITRRNIRKARLDDMIEVDCKSFSDWIEPPCETPGILITNPPYGERLRPEDMEGLYREIGNTLKRVFKGYHAWILGYDDAHFANIGLKASVKFPILNGPLECSLREYVLFDGSYSDFRDRGGSVKNETFDRTVKHKMKYLSDREWENEARKFNRQQHKESGHARSFDERRDDRKPFRKDGDRKSFRRDDDRKPFRKDGDRKPFRKDGGRRRQQELRTVKGKGPKIGEDKTVFASGGAMRSRRGWKKPEE